jgi:hypothetical protein
MENQSHIKAEGMVMEEVKGKTTDQDKMITEAALVPILK